MMAILLLISFMSLFGALTSTPSNIAVLKGQEVAFHCSTNHADSFLWHSLLPGASRAKLIANGSYANEKICFCSVQHANQKSTLYLRANESTAAKYQCTEKMHKTKTTAQLIVLDSDPVCSKSLTEDTFSLTCVINFSGHWSPVVEWTQLTIDREEVKTTYTQNSFRRINTMVSVLSVLKDRRADAYSCTVKFSLSNKPKATTADNIPSYNFHWVWRDDRSETTTVQAEYKNKHDVGITIGGIAGGVMAVVILITVIVVWERNKKSLESERQQRVFLVRHNPVENSTQSSF